jgi:hypothetical protein
VFVNWAMATAGFANEVEAVSQGTDACAKRRPARIVTTRANVASHSVSHCAPGPTRPSAFLGNELKALLDAEEVPFIQV